MIRLGYKNEFKKYLTAFLLVILNRSFPNS